MSSNVIDELKVFFNSPRTSSQVMSPHLLFTLCGGGGGGGGGAALAVAVYAFNIHHRHHPQSSLNGETD